VDGRLDPTWGADAELPWAQRGIDACSPCEHQQFDR
jgi:hypothetical protein